MDGTLPCPSTFTFVAYPHKISVSYFFASRALCFLYTRAGTSKTVSAIILAAPRILHSSVTLLLPPDSTSICTYDCTSLNFICVWRLKWMLFCLHMTFVWKWVLCHESGSQDILWICFSSSFFTHILGIRLRCPSFKTTGAFTHGSAHQPLNFITSSLKYYLHSIWFSSCFWACPKEENSCN